MTRTLSPGHDAGVQHGRGVVAGVLAGPDGIGHGRLAQIALAVALADALVDRRPRGLPPTRCTSWPISRKTTARPVSWQSGLFGVAGQVGVLEQLGEDVPARLGFFPLGRLLEEGHHVVTQIRAGVDGQLGHRLGDLGDVQLPHGIPPRLGPSHATWPRGMRRLTLQRTSILIYVYRKRNGAYESSRVPTSHPARWRRRRHRARLH